jgi:hypothetical protein
LVLKGNNNTLKSEIKCILDIDFTKKDSIGNLLDFKPKKLTSHTRHISDFPCKISQINGLCVECNIVSGAYKNGEQVHVIHEFFLSVPSGYKIIESPSNVVYLPINTKQLDEITIKITDQGPIPPTFFETLHFALFTLPILKSANILRSTNILNHYAKKCKFLCICKANLLFLCKIYCCCWNAKLFGKV